MLLSINFKYKIKYNNKLQKRGGVGDYEHLSLTGQTMSKSNVWSLLTKFIEFKDQTYFSDRKKEKTSESLDHHNLTKIQEQNNDSQYVNQ
jgi:hypothetical protein